MLRNIALKTLRDRGRALVGWSTGFVLIVLMYAAFYPSVRENAASLDEYIRSLPEGVRGFFGETADISSPTDYIQSELFSTFAPLLFLVFTIGAGSRAVAGEEEGKTLDLLLSRCPSRGGASRWRSSVPSSWGPLGSR